MQEKLGELAALLEADLPLLYAIKVNLIVIVIFFAM